MTGEGSRSTGERAETANQGGKVGEKGFSADADHADATLCSDQTTASARLQFL